jgi:starvation-inducible DNA-binding protein
MTRAERPAKMPMERGIDRRYRDYRNNSFPFRTAHQYHLLISFTTTEEIMTDKQAATAAGLSKLLADSYTLYLKTHNYHWNVTGPMFTTLHTLFETQYTELALAVDEIAERIRALGYPAPGSYSRFQALADVTEETGSPSAEDMIRQLVADQQTVTHTAREVLAVADAAGDQPSEDLAIRRMDVHEKNAWMLRSHLE